MFCISERTETWVCWNPKHKDDQNVRIANQEKAVLHKEHASREMNSETKRV